MLTPFVVGGPYPLVLSANARCMAMAHSSAPLADENEAVNQSPSIYTCDRVAGGP